MTLDEYDGALERVRAMLGPHRELLGLATVDLDRAASEIGAGQPAEPLPDDPLLGARCLLVRGADGRSIVLLEPSTEGRLAASLARHGEGLAVRYLLARADPAAALRAAGIALSFPADGPLGRERLVVGGSRWGPYVAIVETRRETGDPGDDGARLDRGRSPATTIEP